LAGVDVSVTTTFSNPGGEIGVAIFRGDIDSLAIAGLELLIDNVSVIVPESSAASLGLAALLMAVRKLRRR
jgi:hypothetical protein